ncbi:MAG TPA: sigma-70 family RNA polymerase sigma factor [Verrucomicrobiae bacterium]|nr:sigma-70 family RNA polymerase sigma factor [Verrucomicrobiae bacterium]
MVNSLNDDELLKRYAAVPSDAVFEILVTRHVNLVYGAALRQVRDTSLAEEVTQTTFLLLARKAASLSSGTILAGWLYRTTRFVAREALRSERRRQARDKAAMETLYEPPGDHHWEDIAPALDQALAELPERERLPLLLRFFENKTLREVGSALGISEDAAQKRVARALDRLRNTFTSEGITVSSATLMTLLSTSGPQAAPAGLAASIVSAAGIGSGLALTSPLFTQTALKLMAFTKLKIAGTALLLVAVTAVPVVVQQRQLTELRNENELVRKEAPVTASAEMPAVEADSDELAKLRRDAAEVLRLRGEIGLLTRENQELARAAASQIIKPDEREKGTDPMARFTLGRELAAQGKHAEALQHFLWCYDEGVGQSRAFAGVRSSFLLMQLSELAKHYAPARDALIARRDAAEQKIISGNPDPYDVHTLLQLNEKTGPPSRMLTLFDELPEGHPARAMIIDAAGEQFIAARRYKDVASGRPEAVFDRYAHITTDSKERAPNDFVQSSLRRLAINSGIGGVEALAGAGDVARAISLADKVLAFDGSAETRGLLLQHAVRAGNADLIAHLRATAAPRSPTAE